MRYDIVFLVSLLLMGFVNAENVNVTIRNYNTLAPVESANISVFDYSYTYNVCQTDSYGFCTFSLGNASYHVIMSKTGYQTLNEYLLVNGDMNEEYYMIPDSSEGIIRMRYSDLSIGGLSINGMDSHQVCFYYNNTGRLQGCYNTNDTIVLGQNQIYVLKIVPNRADVLSGSYGFTMIAQQYSGYIILFLFVIIIVGLVMYIFRNKITARNVR